VNQYDRQQSREATLLQQQMEGESYALKNQFELQQSQEANANKLQIEQMQQQTARANQFEQTKQEWLKQGIAKYSPQNKQQLSEYQRQAAAIDIDPSIPPEHKDQMIANLQGKMQAIIPQIVPEDERPTPWHQKVGETIAVMGVDGKLQSIGGLGRGLQDGEMYFWQDRSGATRAGTYKSGIKPPTDDWNAPKFIAQQREIIRNGLVNQRNSEYDRELRTWEAKQKNYSDGLDRDGPSTSAPPPGPMPSIQKVEDWEVDAKLHAISGGAVMPTIQPPPQNQQGSWPRPAMMGGYSPVQIPTQQQFRESQSQPSQGRGVGGLYRREMNRDVKLAESPAIGEMILNDPEFRQHISKNGNGDMYVGGIIWNRAVVKHSQDRPITVSSQEEAKTLPYGSKFSLNGRTGTVQ
jgi:hypothetical protein